MQEKLQVGCERYMAISHVWADGTGKGNTPGRVNECLFDFFARLARSRDLRCHGIWWESQKRLLEG